MGGIDKVKKVVKVVFDTLLQYKNATADDGKITAMEYLGFADEVFALITVVPQFKAILAQLKDLDDAEAVELAKYIESFGILAENANIILLNILAGLETLYDVYTDNVVQIIAVLKK